MRRHLRYMLWLFILLVASLESPAVLAAPGTIASTPQRLVVFEIFVNPY